MIQRDVSSHPLHFVLAAKRIGAQLPSYSDSPHAVFGNFSELSRLPRMRLCRLATTTLHVRSALSPKSKSRVIGRIDIELYRHAM
jgi:hypothetical protein